MRNLDQQERVRLLYLVFVAFLSRKGPLLPALQEQDLALLELLFDRVDDSFEPLG